MRVLRFSVRMLLRRRSCVSGPLLLLGLGLCLYQTLMLAWNRVRSGQRGRSREPVQRGTLDEDTRRVLSYLEAAQVQSGPPPVPRRAVVLLGQHLVSDPEVQLYQRLLQQMHFEVLLSRSTETSSLLRSNHGAGGWSLLICPSDAESCLRKVSLSDLHRHHMVNFLPELVAAFSDAGGGLCHLFHRSQLTGPQLSMRPFSCGPANHKLPFGVSSQSAARTLRPSLVSVYVLVTSVKPLTSFVHQTCVVMTQQQRGRVTQLRDFLRQQLERLDSHQALEQVGAVISRALQAAASANEKPGAHRCVCCYQLLTFTLLFAGSGTPEIVQVTSDLRFSTLTDDTFDRQISRELVLEDTLHFLLASHTRLRVRAEQYGGCRGIQELCLSEDDLVLLLSFQQQMKIPSNFQLLCPSSSSSSSLSGPASVMDLQVKLSRFYGDQRTLDFRGGLSQQGAAESSSKDEGSCLDPHLRQIYADPALTLAPPFRPGVKVYRTEVGFEMVTVRIRAEPVSPACQVHVGGHQGPRMATFPVGLGDNTIRVLVTDGDGPEPVVMATYTIYLHRENRPSLPMFGEHTMCSFLQDCGLLVQPSQPCGLQPFQPQTSAQTCSSGHVPGQWVVPCLSCSDNRTCDWREVAWQPKGCVHPLVQRPLLQECLANRKVLFMGDSTNRGMMYFLMERVNSSLEDWGRAHDLLVYRNLNAGRTTVSYSYYPQFWLEKSQRPTFRQALLQLISRSRPLLNSIQTVLVVGGVQWLTANHLRTIREVLSSEALEEILVVVKSLGMGFHLPVDGIRSLALAEIQELHAENLKIIQAAEDQGYQVIDTFSITMGRYKEFLQGRCACHFHEVKFSSLTKSNSWTSTNTRTRSYAAGFPSISQSDTEQEAWPNASSYHVRGAVNQVYSEILLSRLCPRD